MNQAQIINLKINSQANSRTAVTSALLKSENSLVDKVYADQLASLLRSSHGPPKMPSEDENMNLLNHSLAASSVVSGLSAGAHRHSDQLRQQPKKTMSGGARQRSQLPPRKPTQTESARSLKPLNQNAKAQASSLNPHPVVKSVNSTRTAELTKNSSRRSFEMSKNQDVLSRIQQEKLQLQA